MTLSPKEMDKLAHLWEFHRRDCDHKGDMAIDYLSGGGIGIVVQATCACGKIMDVTDYYNW